MLKTENTLDIPIRSESKLFDNREKLSLTDATLKDGEEFIDYSADRHVSKDRINKTYFQHRIARERSLLKANPNNIKILIRVGDIYLANQKLDRAKSYYNRAFQIDTENLAAAHKLVDTYMLTGKLDKADQVLNMLKKAVNDDTRHLHGIINLLRNNTKKAEELLESIPSTAKNYFEAVNTLGLVKFNSSHFEEAERLFRISIKSRENYGPAKNNLALALTKRGKLKQAEEVFLEAIKEHPDFINPYHNLFNLYVSQEKLEKAHDLMLSIQHLSQPYNEIQFRIAWSLMKMNKFNDAVMEYNKVLEILPGNPATLNNIGHCYDSMGKSKEAYEYFTRAINSARRGDLVPTLFLRNLMISCEKTGNLKEARHIATQVLKSDPNDAVALVVEGNRLIDTEDWARAFKILLKAYDAKPPMISLYSSLSMIYADLYPDYKKGLEVCEYALQSNIQKSNEILNNLVHLHLVNNNTIEAKKYLKFLNKKNPVSVSTLGLYYLKIDSFDKAQVMYDNVLELVPVKSRSPFFQRRFYDIGRYYQEKNNPIDAIKNFNLSIKHGEGGFKYLQKEAQFQIKSIKLK